jgi:hypothetical protein
MGKPKIIVGKIVRLKDLGDYNYNVNSEVCERLQKIGYKGEPIRYIISRRDYFDQESSKHVEEEIKSGVCQYINRSVQNVCDGCKMVSGRHARIFNIKKIQT